MPHNLTPVMTSLSIGNEFYFSKAWKIERTDGQIFRFTDFSQDVVLSDGETYSAAGGMDGSAVEQTDYTEVDSFKATGVIDSSEITGEDLRKGLFYNAEVTEFQFCSRYPWAGNYVTRIFMIGDIRYNEKLKTWEAEILGQMHGFDQKRGFRTARRCRFRHGDSATCGVNLASFTNTMTVASVTSNVSFTGVPSANDEEDYYEDGTIEWTSGNNNGTTQTIKRYDPDDNAWILQESPPEDVEIGDTANVIAGCNHLSGKNVDGTDDLNGHCKHKFNNLPNFGGIYTLPMNDQYLKTPSVTKTN